MVVVDNASSDETAELAPRHGAAHLRLEQRRSYAAAINDAIAETGGDAVAAAERRLLPCAPAS